MSTIVGKAGESFIYESSKSPGSDASIPLTSEEIQAIINSLQA